MAQNLGFKKFIDVDNTIIRPSSQRVRNILTLDEKIDVIKAYEQRPMYKKVARMFNCSWEQIKNIITNRAAIMEFYNAARSKTKYKDNADEEFEMDVKQRKIKFLGECVYECLKRLQYHAKLPITEELIRHKALEFLDVFCIPGFTPTKKWLNSFKALYNITLSNKQISIYAEPEYSLDIKDIMTYCAKQKTTKCLLTARCHKPDGKNEENGNNDEYQVKRLRKLNFLQEALKEYLLRVKFHHKSMNLDTMSLRKVAQDFNEILKVQDFEPTMEWIESFRKQHDNGECLENAKRPPLSLDLKDILSYCSRMQNKTKDNTITLAPKDTSLQMRVAPKYNISETDLKYQQNSIICLDDEVGTKEAKPDIEEIRVEKPTLGQPPPLKIRKIESINNDPELQRKIPEIPKKPLVTITQVPKEQPQQITKTVMYVQNGLAITVKDNNACLTEIKQETLEDESCVLPTNITLSAPTPPQQLRLQLVQQQTAYCALASSAQQQPPTHTIIDNDSLELPRHVTSFKDALLLLKPLEEYAMLKENYRAIGLITQLEKVLKNESDSLTANE